MLSYTIINKPLISLRYLGFIFSLVEMLTFIRMFEQVTYVPYLRTTGECVLLSPCKINSQTDNVIISLRSILNSYAMLVSLCFMIKELYKWLIFLNVQSISPKFNKLILTLAPSDVFVFSCVHTYYISPTYCWRFSSATVMTM